MILNVAAASLRCAGTTACRLRTSQLQHVKGIVLSTRIITLGLLAAFLVALSTGCATARPAQANLPAAVAPNPNAPYTVPAGSRPTSLPLTPEAEAEARPCHPRHLSIEQISGNSNGNLRSLKLAFVNRGSVPCKLSGYPGVALLKSHEGTGKVSAEHVTWTEVRSELAIAKPAAPPRKQSEGLTVTLMPHAVAAFELAWTTGQACTAVTHLLLTCPGTGRSFSVSQPTNICNDPIQVTALRLDPYND